MTGSWEIALAGTIVGILGNWLTKVTEKCKWYIVKPKDSSCCPCFNCCSSCECALGFTKKPIKPDDDVDTEIKIAHINGVDIAYINKRGNFIVDLEDASESDR